uniref:Uncharacterized protein n=1 Tax=Tanacetum cinerariifolium TaxID=118510 RepID=A0A699HIF1_TANCI|nr:hypothetical protein [Tanacetum cinerariifolium]
MGDDLDISALTIEQYLDLIQDKNRPSIVKPKIGDDVEFEINSNFMRELKRKLFAGTDDEDAHEHVQRVKKSRQELGKESVKEPDPHDLPVFQTYAPPTLFLGHLKVQMGSPYRTQDTVCAIGILEEIHENKAQGDKRDMKDGWDITIKDVERLRQFRTPTIHTLPHFEPVIQPYIPLVPVQNEKKVVKEEEHDYDDVKQPLTPYTFHTTPPNDGYVALATNPILDK